MFWVCAEPRVGHIEMFLLLLSVPRAEAFSAFPTATLGKGRQQGRLEEGYTCGKLRRVTRVGTPTDHRDIPDHVPPCSVLEYEEKAGR